MKLDLESIANSPGARWTHEFSLALPSDGEIELVGPVEGKITVTNTGQLLLAQGEMSARVRVECGRCGEPVVIALSAPIQEEFSLPTPEGQVVGPPDTIDREDPAESAFADGMLDLTELLRQHVVVALPLTPLCTPECKGLCSHCGKSLNDGPCGCAESRADSPFGALGSLLRGSDEVEEGQGPGPGRQTD